MSTPQTLAEWIARIDHHIRPAAVSLPPSLVTWAYSQGRTPFLKRFCTDKPPLTVPPLEQQRTLWGIQFRSGLFNAAGVFKNGEGYDTCFRQGAGAYLAGTTTAFARAGNVKNGYARPFVPYPRSHAASNWLGLPNDGHAAVAQRLSELPRYKGFPVLASLMTAPESHGTSALDEVVYGMKLYEQAGVDVLEINESCPNVEHGSTTIEQLAERLDYIARAFLRERRHALPVIVKFSTDTAIDDVPSLLDILLTLGFDGINFGNTSTRYAVHRAFIAQQEQNLYDYFTATFGGGISGKPLANDSLALVQAAAHYLSTHQPRQEFHIIRTGGVSSYADVQQSWQAGASLCQWYTGYFEGFARYGHSVYQHVYQHLCERPTALNVLS
jgi:dihydroorotate dehydrogenase